MAPRKTKPAKTGNPVRLLRDAYVEAFSGATGARVLKDLARFCCANRSTYETDPRDHALREGRREVWLKIQTMLNLTEKQVRSYDETDEGDD